MELFFASIIKDPRVLHQRGFMGILLVVSIVGDGHCPARHGTSGVDRPPALAAEIESLQPGDDLDKLEHLIAAIPLRLDASHRH